MEERQDSVGVADKVDPIYLALSRFRRRRFDDSANICTEVLEQNPYDQVRQQHPGQWICWSTIPVQAVWFLKCRSLTEKAYVKTWTWRRKVWLTCCWMRIPRHLPLGKAAFRLHDCVFR